MIENHEAYDEQTFENLNLTGLKVTAAAFDTCRFTGCNFSETVFRDCWFTDCRFLECNLSVTAVPDCRFSEVVFEDCKAVGIDWTRADWPKVMPFSPITFHRCIISDASFWGLTLKDMAVESCRAHDVDFREGGFQGADFRSTDFAGSLFSGTDLSGADFTNAANYRIDINGNIIRKAVFTRYEALTLLDSLGVVLVD